MIDLDNKVIQHYVHHLLMHFIYTDGIPTEIHRLLILYETRKDILNEFIRIAHLMHFKKEIINMIETYIYTDGFFTKSNHPKALKYRLGFAFKNTLCTNSTLSGGAIIDL